MSNFIEKIKAQYNSQTKIEKIKIISGFILIFIGGPFIVYTKYQEYEAANRAKILKEEQIKISELKISKDNQEKFAQQKLLDDKKRYDEIIRIDNEKKERDFYKPNISYTYYGNGNCKNSNTTFCITYDQYKDACMKLKSVTQNAVNFAAVMHNFETREIAKNGEYLGKKIIWDTKLDKCYVWATYSGVYNGSSSKVIVEGVVKTFKLDDSNELIVTSFSIDLKY